MLHTTSKRNEETVVFWENFFDEHDDRKSFGKPPRRKFVPSWDRVDNNLALLSKNLGHVRTMDHKRDMKSTWAQVVSDFDKFDLATLHPHFANVHNTLQSLTKQPHIKRANYPAHFKTSLKWMNLEPGISILKSAAESAGICD